MYVFTHIYVWTFLKKRVWSVFFDGCAPTNRSIYMKVWGMILFQGNAWEAQTFTFQQVFIQSRQLFLDKSAKSS